MFLFLLFCSLHLPLFVVLHLNLPLLSDAFARHSTAQVRTCTMAANHAQPVSPHPFGFCTSHWSTGKCQKDTCKDFAHVTHEEAAAHMYSPDWLKNELWTNCKLPAVQLQR